MCKFPLTGCLQKKFAFFFAKSVQFVSLFQRLSEKIIVFKIRQVEVLHEKSIIQAVCLRTQAVSIKARF